MNRDKTLTPKPLFLLEKVSKSFNGKVALSHLSLAIKPGERLALIGPSGSGKTTLLKILAGVVKPDSGKVLINGNPADTLKPGKQLARQVGMMQQQFNLVDQLPVIHNVLAGRLGQWGFFRSLLSLVVHQEKHKARHALERVGIPEKLYEKTANLSGGEQQRVALARLLVQQPRAVLADEPVSSLDPTRAEDLLSMLARLSGEENHTLVVSLHSVDYALQYFPRVIALRRGKLLFDRPNTGINRDDLNRLYTLED